MDFNMIILCWGPLLSARLVPKSSIFTPKTSNLEHELSRNLFLLFFTGGSYHPEVNVSFNDLFRDTPLDHIWQGQQNTQIQPNAAKYCNWPVSGHAKYGWVGYPWKDHTKWSSDTLTSGRPERWIVTIPSSDQWLATIGNHWETIATNGFGDQKPLKNHC